MRFLDLKDRGDRLFVGFLASMVVVTAILGWQAVESQEVKTALKGGFTEPVVFDETANLEVGVGDGLSIRDEYVNEGDRTLTLEGAELIEPSENIDLVEIAVFAPEVAFEPIELEGYEVGRGEAVSIWVELEVTEVGEPAGFEGLRVHYRAGGRAGQTP